MSNLPSLPSAQGRFLTKQQKQVGTVAVAGAGVAVAAGAYQILPAVVAGLGMAITAVGQTIVLGGLLAVAGIGGYILLSPKTWSIIKSMRMAVAQKAADAFVHHNAIDYMRAFADEYLDVKYRQVKQGLDTILGKEKLFEERITRNKESLTADRKKAAHLKERSYQESLGWTDEEDAFHFRSLSQTISRTEAQNERYVRQLTRINALKELMVKLERVFRFKTQSTREQVRMLVDEFEANREAAEAVESAQDAFGGGDEFARLFEASTAHVEGSIAEFTGTVDAFLLTAPRMLRDVELEGDMAEMELLASLSSWDEALEGLVVGAQREQRALSSGSAKDLLHSLEMDQRSSEGASEPRRSSSQKRSRYRMLGDGNERSGS